MTSSEGGVCLINGIAQSNVHKEPFVLELVMRFRQFQAIFSGLQIEAGINDLCRI